MSSSTSDECIPLCDACSHSLPTYGRFEPSSSNMLAEMRGKYAPVDAEILSVRKDIQEAIELELNPLDNEIERIRDLLSNLQGRREVVQAYIGQKESLLVPIRLLPFEIISLIFSFSCPGNIFSVRKSAISIPALPLSQVCKPWRDLAHQSPSIWSNITILLGAVATDSFDRYHEKLGGHLAHCITLSGDHDLTVSLVPPSPPDGSLPSLEARPSYAETSMISKLVDCSERWDSLTMAPGAYSFWKLPVPNLKELHVLGDPHRIFTGSPVLLQGFPAQNINQVVIQGFPVQNVNIGIQAPPALANGGLGNNFVPGQAEWFHFGKRFTHFALDVTGLDLPATSSLLRFPLPWKDLSHVTLRHATTSDTFSLLTLNCDLKHLTRQSSLPPPFELLNLTHSVVSDPYFRNWHTTEWAVTFEKLHSLDLVDLAHDILPPPSNHAPPPDVVPDTRALAQILSMLTLPSLENLIVHGTQVNPLTLPRPEMMDFFARSSPPLRRLALSDVILKKGDLMEILATCPSIEDLTLKHCGHLDAAGEFQDLITSDVFETLVLSPSQENHQEASVLPRLARFDIAGDKLNVEQSLLRFLVSRSQTLRFLRMEFSELAFSCERDQLKVLRRSGMVLCLNGDWAVRDEDDESCCYETESATDSESDPEFDSDSGSDESDGLFGSDTDPTFGLPSLIPLPPPPPNIMAQPAIPANPVSGGDYDGDLVIIF